ncbi:MAG: MFS transporter [Planctomycetota bacterium]
MSAVCGDSAVAAVDQDRRNFWIYLFDGGIWMLAMSFIDMSLVVPQMSALFLDTKQCQIFVNSLPIFALITFVGSLLTAALTEQLRNQKSMVIGMALAQRLPLLFAGLGLLLFGAAHPVGAFWFAMFMVAIFFFVGGLVTNPWNELFLKTFVVQKRSGIIGKRMLLGQFLTITLGCFAVKALMPAAGADKAAAAHSFGWLFLGAFVFCMTSWLVISRAWEPETPARPRKNVGMFSYLKRMPHILRNDLYFTKYLWTAILGLGWIPVMPNFSLYITHALHKGPAYAGYLVGVSAAGALAGNVIAGRMGDARGGRFCLLWSRALAVCVMVGLFLPASELLFTVLVALLAASLQIMCVGDYAYVTEMAPEAERPSYLSIYRLLLVPVMIAGVGIGLLYAWLDLAPELVMLFGALSMAACLALTFALPEPREERARAAGAAGATPSTVRAMVIKPLISWPDLWRRRAG